jgi:CRISPR-associated endonuclease/helicase Cas3
MQSYLEYWGKTAPGQDPSWHPLAHHQLDVAAAADAILRVRPRMLERGSALLGLPAEDVIQLVRTLAALHDMGKFAPFFQYKSPEHAPSELAALEAREITSGLHTEDGLCLWDAGLGEIAIAALWPRGARMLGHLVGAVFGHHGLPVDARNLDAGRRFRAARNPAISYARDALRLLSPAPITARSQVRDGKRASWWLAGVINLADWVGSNQTWFPPCAPVADPDPLAAYWQIAGARARTGVAEAGLHESAPRRGSSYEQITGRSGQPTPMQEWALGVELPEGPTLVIIEDVTGSGKTEAAEILVNRMIAAGRASGAYWAMPTQATANAMYRRQEPALLRIFENAEGALPSLVLAHGGLKPAKAFRPTVLGGPDAWPGLATGAAPADGEVPSSEGCAAFLTDDRRTALLSDLGVGTIDQALLGVLPARHAPLRALGLADHVLVVDEAHAYDAYTSENLRNLLEFQAGLGGSAIVLSATLSEAQRDWFCARWQAVLSTEAAAREMEGPPATTAYPLATVVSRSGVEDSGELEAPAWSRRTVPVRMIHSRDVALEHVERVSRAGGCGIWIRNTVRDCLAAAAELRSRRAERVIVFHSRFTAADRQAIEARILDLFGPDSTPDDRAGWIVVATQVVEQSLDLDFDVMVSDIAPVDLLIQRAGRLWRHPRREEDGERPRGCTKEMLVLAPMDASDAAEWQSAQFGGTAKVYARVDVLWRTARALRGAGAEIRAPEGLRELIRAVYGPGEAEATDAIKRISVAGEAEERAGRDAALHAKLKLHLGYVLSGGWQPDIDVRTRLGAEGVRARLARVDQSGVLVPFSVRGNGAGPWQLAELSAGPWVVEPGSTSPAEFGDLVDAAKRLWGRYEQHLPILVLQQEADGTWGGSLATPSGGVRRYAYSASGLVQIP